MDRGAWQATAHGVTKSWTQLSDIHTTGHMPTTSPGQGGKLQCQANLQPLSRFSRVQLCATP